MTKTELLAEEEELRARLRDNLAKQAHLDTAAICQKYGIATGDVIEWIDGKETKKGKIISIGGTAYYPNIRTLRFKKDGTIGVREEKLWSYNLPSIRVIEKTEP